MSASANASFAASLVAGLVEGGVRDVVVSPGSRSAPLALAIAARRELRAHVVVDERAAAFVGLGLARGSGRPVALLATSGSAGAHWLPAIVEADLAGVPLVAITADRPPELVGCGAPQAIEQRALLSGRTRGFEHVGPAGDGTPPGWPAASAARLVDLARGPAPGPVHLNVALREPLWAPGASAPAGAVAPRILRPRPRVDAAAARATLGALLDARRPAWPALDDPLPEDEDARGRARRDPPCDERELVGGSGSGCGEPARGVILAGPRAAGTLAAEPAFAAALVALARALGWPILADPLSGLRAGPHERDAVVASADALLRDPECAAALRPTHALRFGQVPTSKVVTTWLADAGPRLALVDPAGQWHDPGHAARALLVADPTLAARALRRALPAGAAAEPGWHEAWRRADDAAQGALERALGEDDAAWEGGAARDVLDALSTPIDGGRLHVASSLAVRDVDAFGGARDARLAITSNRGANGIDGTVATAAGLSLASGERVTVLLGDLALVHDLGGVVAARELGARLDLVVIDNGGGGIFGHLPIARHPTAFERLFLTPVAADLRALLEGAGVPCRDVHDRAALRAALAAPRAAGPLEAPLRAVRLVVDRATGLRRREAALRAMSTAAARALAAEEVSR